MPEYPIELPPGVEPAKGRFRPSNIVTLICPPNAEAMPISHGTTAFRPYLADPRDSGSVWLVDVPLDAARHFVGAGFWPADLTQPGAQALARFANPARRSGSH